MHVVTRHIAYHSLLIKGQGITLFLFKNSRHHPVCPTVTPVSCWPHFKYPVHRLDMFAPTDIKGPAHRAFRVPSNSMHAAAALRIYTLSWFQLPVSYAPKRGGLPLMMNIPGPRGDDCPQDPHPWFWRLTFFWQVGQKERGRLIDRFVPELVSPFRNIK